MKPANRSVDHVLNMLSRRDLLQLLAYVQRRRACDDVITKLLMDRLSRLVSEPESLLTVAEVAKRLSVSRGRVYELVRGRKLAKVTLGEKQVRIPDSAIRALSMHPVRSKADREAVL